MKHFIYRVRSNVLWFIVALALFTAVYSVCANLTRSYDQAAFFSHAFLLDGISPVIVSLFVCFAFFLVYTKRNNYEEDYFYGCNRATAFGASFCGALFYSVMFAFYAMGVAMLTRRAFLNGYNIIVTPEIYYVSAREITLSLLLTTVVNMLAYQTANLLRNFRSWKFWSTFLFCLSTMIIFVFTILMPVSNQHAVTKDNFWQMMLPVFSAQLAIMTCCDFLLTRGRLIR